MRSMQVIEGKRKEAKVYRVFLVFICRCTECFWSLLWLSPWSSSSSSPVKSARHTAPRLMGERGEEEEKRRRRKTRWRE